VAAALGGCSGTRFGDQLARSFSTPEQSPPAAAAPPAVAPTKPAAAAAPAPKAAAPSNPSANPSSAASPGPTPAPPGQPAPYRVTLRLPAADSSAPAERVTQALRAAGVSFEVETIERIPSTGEVSALGNGNGGNLGAPRRIPAPAPR